MLCQQWEKYVMENIHNDNPSVINNDNDRSNNNNNNNNNNVIQSNNSAIPTNGIIINSNNVNKVDNNINNNLLNAIESEFLNLMNTPDSLSTKVSNSNYTTFQSSLDSYDTIDNNKNNNDNSSNNNNNSKNNHHKIKRKLGYIKYVFLNI